VSENEIKAIYQALRNLQALVDVLQWVAHRFDRAVDHIERQQAIDDVIRELSEYLTNSIDHLEQVLIVLLEQSSGQSTSRTKQETDRLLQQTLKNRLRSLKLQIGQHHANLNWAEEQAAMYGPNVTMDITNKIIWEKRKLEDMQKEYEYIKKQVEQ